MKKIFFNVLVLFTDKVKKSDDIVQIASFVIVKN